MAYKLEEVARSICSSKALLAEDPNHPAMAMQLFPLYEMRISKLLDNEKQ